MNGTDRETLPGFVDDHAAPGAELYTDDASAYKGSDRPHYTVRHSTGQYVVGDVHTNGIESFWAMLKRSYHGVYHRMSPKHLQRYVNEIASRQNIRELDTIEPDAPGRHGHGRPAAASTGTWCHEPRGRVPLVGRCQVLYGAFAKSDPFQLRKWLTVAGFVSSGPNRPQASSATLKATVNRP